MTHAVELELVRFRVVGYFPARRQEDDAEPPRPPAADAASDEVRREVPADEPG